MSILEFRKGKTVNGWACVYYRDSEIVKYIVFNLISMTVDNRETSVSIFDREYFVGEYKK